MITPLEAISELMLAYAVGTSIDCAISVRLSQVWGYVLAFGLYIVLYPVVNAVKSISRQKLLQRAAFHLKSDLMGSLLTVTPQEPFLYDTTIAENVRLYDDSISDGDVQRALARKAPVLLLDESTSHLDPATAREIEQVVLGAQDTLVIPVSHNASADARAWADHIIRLDNGGLREVK